MYIPFTIDELNPLGLASSTHTLFEKIQMYTHQATTALEAWQLLYTHVLPDYPFHVHLFIFSLLFPNWRNQLENSPVWIPNPSLLKTANIAKFMSKLTFSTVKTFHHWTFQHYQDFWQIMVNELKIVFDKNFNHICDLSNGITSPKWFPGATLNISDSCFTATPSKTALIYLDAEKRICKMSYGELNQLVNRVANSLIKLGITAGDVVGIIMPMNIYAVAIYLSIIKMGGIVVSIADSFSSDEIATRLKIARAKAVFTQDYISWAGKKLPLYEKIKNCNNSLNISQIKMIVLPNDESYACDLHKDDYSWHDFLTEDINFTSIPCEPMAACHLLFSSGTTAEPKAIIWNHTTPIKAASDAYFHQNIQPDDVLAWPTNLGWMMGPWLIFASLINHATIALYPDAPKDRDFGEFIQNANVTILGVVPTLVATWRQSQCMEKLNWNNIKVFSSTGECSNPEDMFYLMSLANYKPIIEYCGGTEIGGAYISSTVIENNIPSLFSTPTMGMNFLIIDEHGKPTDVGEVAIIPPSIGLSTMLWNANHEEVYFADMPKTPVGESLRRHGDQLKRFLNGYYTILGRVDDTMNLGGIKISAAEIERVVLGLPHILEVAAIAIAPPDNGPNQLIIYVSTTSHPDKLFLMKEMQKKINLSLNPLFKIHDVVITNELPKTASNKIMRRMLRKKYMEK